MKRWPIIRHIRWAILDYKAHRWAQYWHKAGVGLGVPNDNDLAYLQAVWDGEC